MATDAKTLLAAATQAGYDKLSERELKESLLAAASSGGGGGVAGITAGPGVVVSGSVNVTIGLLYKSFVAIVNKAADTSAPTLTVLQNDFTGVTFTPAYESVGFYTIAASSAIFTAKTYIPGGGHFIGVDNNGQFNSISIASTSVLRILDGSGDDFGFDDNMIEVRVYP